MTGALVLLVLGLLLLVQERRAVRASRDELGMVAGQFTDRSTNMLTANALPVRLQPELDWAVRNRLRVGCALVRVYAHHDDQVVVARDMRSRMRGHENGFVLQRGTYLLALWDCDADAALRAVARLVGPHAVHHPIDVAIVLFPDHAADIAGLLSAAEQRYRPLQDFVDAAGRLVAPSSPGATAA